MGEFTIKRKADANIQEIRNISREIARMAEDTNRIASSIKFSGDSYAGIERVLAAIKNQLAIESDSVRNYSNAGSRILDLYFNTELKITKGVFVPRVSASDSVKTKKQIDDLIKKLDRLLIKFISFFGLSEATKKKYRKYLERYRKYLYEENGIVTEKPPVEKPQEEQPPVEQPPVEKPQEEQPPVEQPPVEKPQEEKPPVQTTPEPPKPPAPPVVDRTPNYSNKLFDNKGMYGARQRLNVNSKDNYEIIRMFYPEWSDAQCKKLINRLGPEGCGYATIANAVFWAYEGRAEEFENAYGISMYKNGDLNYDELVLYMYTQYDQDTIDGLTPGDQGDILTDFMQQAGHSMEAEYFYEPTKESIPSDLNKGLLTFATQGSFDITDASTGKTLHFDEAHVMTVTGVRDDGTLIVSTWGGKYYIDPSKCVGPYYTLFKFDTRG